MKVAMVVNIPAPYRVPVYDRLARLLDGTLLVVYMAPLEHGRKWRVPALRHKHVYLRGAGLRLGERTIHMRHGAMAALRAFGPDVIVTGSFSPPMLAAWTYAMVARIPHIPMTDGWLHSEAGLSPLHKAARRVILGRSRAFIGASEKSLDLYRAYKADHGLFLSPLAVDNEAFAAGLQPTHSREFDLTLSGHLIDRKLPLFFADVVACVARRRASQTRVQVIGDGPLLGPLRAALARTPTVHATFTGFLQQEQLPAAYRRAKLLCFPTRVDPWGVVANEACAAGAPVITCDNAGCAGELVVHGDNGYVLPLDAVTWAAHIVQLLERPTLLDAFGENARAQVSRYTFDAAARGVLDACRYACVG